ncbi:MAG TPA: hypothetical protein VGN72_08945 [Tepidisphaeraceae bacterium]|jgi:hypothetical protein|nr:hypothetical protein [Tepidisphaeraceae bacterium]
MPDASLLPPPTSSVIDRLPVVIAIALFAALSIATGFASEAFLEADACLHYLYSRFALAEPYRLVDVWGRPICTAYYALPAALMGRTGTRLASLVLALAVAIVAMGIARRQGYRWPALALIFTLAQPMVFTHSFSELTELPFALLVGAAFLAYQARRFVVMTLIVAFMPLSRPEGFGFMVMALAALLLHRRWATVLLLPVGMVLWNHVGWELFGRQEAWWRWLPDHWPYAAASTYAPGYLLHFVAALPAVVSPMLFPATVAGIVLCGSVVLRGCDGLRAFFADHRHRCDLLIAAIPLSILIVHSLLYWRGLMASNGELRYLLTMAGFWGVLSARGWAWASDRLQMRRVYTWAGVACLVPVFMNAFVYTVLPLKLDDNWRTARAVATRLDEPAIREGAHPLVMASHPGIFYFLDVSPIDGTRVRDLNVQTITTPPPGTRLIFDSLYATHNADRGRVTTEADILAAGWLPDEELQAVIDAIAREAAEPTTAPLTGHRTGLATWRAFKSPDSSGSLPPVR